ncbi:hypothetical protein HMPREF0080_00182 [Anaeroglobus geminatus F0357]|uniref:Uncharacterized protein n=1 Tax=Anaeroglobus geminatus F0357 TaxID=861450 RepID=G9YEX2_9FIRM|nr:hypothetical protein HMPREF0080_00182 [Anaeroglobus geminatus F0357]
MPCRAASCFGSDTFLYTETYPGELLLWSIFDKGLKDGCLEKEPAQAERGANTRPCFYGCNRCDSCGGHGDDAKT